MLEFKILPYRGFILKAPDGGIVGFLYSRAEDGNKIGLMPAFNMMNESLADYIHTILWKLNRKLEEITEPNEQITPDHIEEVIKSLGNSIAFEE